MSKPKIRSKFDERATNGSDVTSMFVSSRSVVGDQHGFEQGFKLRKFWPISVDDDEQQNIEILYEMPQSYMQLPSASSSAHDEYSSIPEIVADSKAAFSSVSNVSLRQGKQLLRDAATSTTTRPKQLLNVESAVLANFEFSSVKCSTNGSGDVDMSDDCVVDEIDIADDGVDMTPICEFGPDL